MKYDRLILRVVIIVMLMIIIFTHFAQIKPSGYELAPRPITTNMSAETPNMFQHAGEQKCVPSATSEEGAYYTDTRGGICGDQKYVNHMGHEYILTGGIGGSLLSQ
jgi:hypothetical protein